MSIAIGLDFGSLGYRAAYVLDHEIISVPMPPDEAAWRGLLFVDADPRALPLGLTFSSLKYQLGTGRRFSWRGGTLQAEDAVREIFTNIKRAVETYAGEEIGQAVIAVPAQYPALRRSIVREVAMAAGFGHVDLINDCTAAALGHTYGRDSDATTLLHYSMGFIGFEVSLVRCARQRMRELVHEGAATPAGRDFDLLTMAAAMEFLDQQGHHLPIKVFTSQWFDLRMLVSDLKEALSSEPEAVLDLPPYITGTETMRLRFGRADFETGVATRIESTLGAVRQVLEDSGMRAQEVDEVVLVGGSTRMGVVQRELESLFGQKLVQPRDDLIARGAAVQASRLAQEGSERSARDGSGTSPALILPEQPLSAVAPQEAEPEPAEPSLEPLLAYARRLAETGRREAASAFLDKLDGCSRTLREQLSGT